MSPLRKHSGGRPRSANSVLDFAERWGISEKSARRLRATNVPDETMAILVAETKRYREAQLCKTSARGKYVGGLKALGMFSRVPALKTAERIP
jgi:hypothetical protein